MKQLIPVLIFILFSGVTGQLLEQTDWSGGPGQQGPDYFFYTTFWTSHLIDWSTQGSITLLQDWSHDDYPDSGTLVSSLAWIPMGTDWEIEWGNIEWISNEPDSTSISFQLRTGMSPGTMGEWTDPITESGTYLGTILPDTILLIQYRAILTSADSSVAPELESIIINGWYPGGIEEGQSGMQNSGILDIKSNPASVLNISVHLLEPGHITLQLFDAAGRLQFNVAEGYLEQGDYDYHLDDLPDGMYVVRFDVHGYAEMEKVTILRLQ